MTTGGGLVVEGLTVRYGDALAVHDVSLTVGSGEIVALLGANGAGKSSLVAALSGLVPATARRLEAGSVDLRRLGIEERARHVAHVPEGRRLFPELTVHDNLVLGAYGHARHGEAERCAHVLEVLPHVSRIRNRAAFGLSGGEQQMVALGRGLMAGAPVLAIDELSLGLAPIVASGFAATLEDLRRDGMAILLVEQYLTLALQVADRVVVLERGRMVLEAPVAEARAQLVELQAAYLGRADDAVLRRLDRAADAASEPAEEAPPPPSEPTAVVAVASAAVLVASTFAPWFVSSSFAHGTSTLTGWDVPVLFGAVPSLLACGAAALTLASRRRPLRRARAAAAGAAAAALVLLFARTWLLGDGLAGFVDSGYTRRWGLLLALQAAGVLAVDMVRRATPMRDPAR